MEQLASATDTSSFQLKRLSDSAFIGPFGAMIHTSHVGRYLFGLTIALSGLPGLPVRYREIAILVVGARFKAPYETYAHSRVGSVFGLPQEEIDEFVAGSKPKQLSDSGAVAYDVAHELVSKAGPLNEEIWLQACKQFGKGAIALVHYNGYYMYTCTVLNGFNIAIPDGA